VARRPRRHQGRCRRAGRDGQQQPPFQRHRH
jgi:hypothetical protein